MRVPSELSVDVTATAELSVGDEPAWAVAMAASSPVFSEAKVVPVAV